MTAFGVAWPNDRSSGSSRTSSAAVARAGSACELQGWINRVFVYSARAARSVSPGLKAGRERSLEAPGGDD